MSIAQPLQNGRNAILRKASRVSKSSQAEAGKLVFPPLLPQQAKDQIDLLLRQSPRQHGIKRTRWRLQDVGRALSWLNGYSDAGIHKVLKRLGFSRKAARGFIRSPDPHYHDKWRAILQAFQEAVSQPEKVVLLLIDELTYYRRPSEAPAYYRQGKSQPKARKANRPNTRTRVAAALNAITGQVIYIQRSKIGKQALIPFYAQMRAAYPHAEKIYLVQDNWSPHKLPEVMQTLQANRLTALFFPTYASWLNPIEKLWRWLRQEVIHMHNLANDLETLRSQVIEFLDQFALGSDPLLHYVGLLSD